MAKKSKDPTKTKTKNPNPTTSQNPDSSNILTKLFGEIPESDPSNSLFSSENPFKRKPTNPIQENPKTIETQKKIKQDNPKRDNFDTNLGAKPSKDSNLGDGQNSNLQMGDENMKKMKKKRKRDEIEREYEVKKYGEEEEEEEVVEVGPRKGKRKVVDNPAETMKVSQEGYDDESKLLRTVFVGNLPLKVKKKALLKEFSQFGEVESVRIRSVPTLDGKKPKKVQVISGKINEAADSVNAYIVFKTEQSAEASLAHNMSVVGGNHIRVDRACPPRKKLKADDVSTPLYSNKRTVFVGNLPFDVKDEELYQLFCGMKQIESSVEAVRVIRDRTTNLGKGIAYVLFKTREAANLVCKKHKLRLRDRELRLCHAKSDTQSTPSKRKNPFPSDPEGTPNKKFSPAAKSSESRYKVSTSGGNTSYQGLRASKSGVEKKRTPVKSASFKPATKSREKKVKERTGKRPAVAARKAKANGKAVAAAAAAAPNKTGNKRKMDARTPQSSNQKKKVKKF